VIDSIAEPELARAGLKSGQDQNPEIARCAVHS